MPKKFVGENSKAVAARARKAAAKEAENVKKAIEAEDKAWEDNDKQLLKKKQKQVRLRLLLTDLKLSKDKRMWWYLVKKLLYNVYFINIYIHTHRKNSRKNANSN